MKSVIYTIYRCGDAGLSNLIMSFELGVILSDLTDRVLILKGNKSPPANVVDYKGVVRNTYPSRVTDLIDLGVPWIDAEQCNLSSFAPHELCDQPVWESVFYFPAHLSTESEDIRAFAGNRRRFITVTEEQQEFPALSLSGGVEFDTLGHYSYFFYLDRASLTQAHDALRRMRPKKELSEFAARVAGSLGAFNAVHIRRGDFKVTTGVTTLNRKPAEVIELLDYHFSRDDRLVILTDEAEDPFFNEIRAAYGDHLFLDHHILENYGADFADLPAHDSIALAYLSQLVAAESQDFVGTMTSTFTGLIQRMRGNLRKPEPFKYLWNELPDPDDEPEPGRHAISYSVPLDKGVMVEEREGPYSWNRYNERINPSWMREWPESFLDEAAMIERAGDRKIATAETSETAIADTVNYSGSCRIAFQDDDVLVSSNHEDTVQSMKLLFEQMLSTRTSQTISKVRIQDNHGQAQLIVDGQNVDGKTDTSKILRRSYREIVSRFISRRPELVWFHAGCAASANEAIVLPGAWGRGKSSLVLALCERGWSFLSDDIVPLDPVKGLAIPFPGTPQVRSKANHALPREKLGTLAKAAVRLDPAKVAQQPHQVAMIVFPNYREGAPSELKPLSPGQAVGELLENSLSFTINDDATIQRLCAVVEKLPAYRLTFDDVDDAADLLISSHIPPVQPAPISKQSLMTNKVREKEEPMTDGVRNVDLEVTLEGGVRHQSVLPSDSPLLHDLHAAIALRHMPDAALSATLLQLPMDGGQAACSFLSTSVISVVTNPPVLVQSPILHGGQSPAAGMPASPLTVQIDDFLTPGENEALLAYALENEGNFEVSTVTSDEEDYRKSRVLFSIGDSKWRRIFETRLKLHLPHIVSTLNVLEFGLGDCEIQLTASNDGDYFKPHPDTGEDKDGTSGRELTYVYYLHRTPKPYSGGGLVLYDGEPGNCAGACDRGQAATSVQPQNNSLIAFDSSRWHEVDMVRCPSGAFADSRFTVNGWLKRKAQ